MTRRVKRPWDWGGVLRSAAAAVAAAAAAAVAAAAVGQLVAHI